MTQRYKTLADFFEQTGTTQQALAGKLGIQSSYVSLITSGQRQPSLKLALRISEETGVPIETLVRVA